MQPSRDRLNFHGPYSVTEGTEVPRIEDCDVASSHGGIYLTAVEFDSKYLINYVGEAHGQTLLKRIKQGISWERSEGICVNADRFVAGARETIRPRSHDEAAIERVVAAYRFFIAPLTESEKPYIQAVEATFIARLRNAGPQCVQFLANHAKSTSEVSVMIESIENDAEFIGIPVREWL